MAGIAALVHILHGRRALTRGKKMLRKRQAGMTLTETLLVLGVGAMAAAIAYGGYRMTADTMAVARAVDGTNLLARSIKRAWPGDYTGLHSIGVISSKIVPDELRTNGSSEIYTPWGGRILPQAGAAGVPTPTTKFKLNVAGVPAGACVDFVNGVAAGAESVWVGGSTAGTHDVKPAGQPVQVQRLIDRCAAVTPASWVTVVIS